LILILQLKLEAIEKDAFKQGKLESIDEDG